MRAFTHLDHRGNGWGLARLNDLKKEKNKIKIQWKGNLQLTLLTNRDGLKPWPPSELTASLAAGFKIKRSSLQNLSRSSSATAVPRRRSSLARCVFRTSATSTRGEKKGGGGDKNSLLWTPSLLSPLLLTANTRRSSENYRKQIPQSGEVRGRAQIPLKVNSVPLKEKQTPLIKKKRKKEKEKFLQSKNPGGHSVRSGRVH